MGLQDDVDAITFGYAFGNASTAINPETFTLHRHGFPPVRVTGDVERFPPMPDMQTGEMKRRITVFVAAKYVTRIQCPGSTVEIPFNIGDVAQMHAVTQIIQQDASGWLLQVG